MIEGIKNVLVTIAEEGRGKETSAFEYGLSLARQANAHLTVQAAAARFYVPYSMLDDFSQAIISTENRRIAVLAEAFAERAKAEADFAGVVCGVESPQLHFSELIDRFLANARVHDISVLNAESSKAEIDWDLIETCLFDSGRPVMVIPPGRTEFACRHVIIAWDGSASASRAVLGAMPFLKFAEAVEIVSVLGEKDLPNSVPGADLAPHLARHGVNVSVSNTTLASKETVAAAIQREAAGFEASLIVSGAYRHSRVREWLLGGVTRSMLEQCSLPLLMAH
ncbi:universal stress protein [Bosea psychrotolerans]|uniref:Universal stress protein family protein n=1 Tax=Bosea psychrotolerans TaxID=1871628 RepID=A0A2S4LXK7_9HYPH|nr:universal stress protein [Bosea psychrotolerans]POR47115.1 universal stress protein family protein [Bosea psychrotolerans]